MRRYMRIKGKGLQREAKAAPVVPASGRFPLLLLVCPRLFQAAGNVLLQCQTQRLALLVASSLVLLLHKDYQ